MPARLVNLFKEFLQTLGVEFSVLKVASAVVVDDQRVQLFCQEQGSFHIQLRTLVDLVQKSGVSAKLSEFKVEFCRSPCSVERCHGWTHEDFLKSFVGD